MPSRDSATSPPSSADRDHDILPSKGEPSNRKVEPGRVLIVEDDYLVASELEATLAEAGLQIVGIASTADQAISLARAERPDLAVVDVRLIGARDGVDAALTMFNELGIRSIFASAHDDADTRARAKAASPIAWVAKPYAPARLIPLINNALSSLSR